MKGMTAAHNHVRARADRPSPLAELSWSCGLAKIAQAHADTLASRGCLMRHSRGTYGENLYSSYGLEPTPEHVVRNWASELACYEPTTDESGMCVPVRSLCSGCGHYTQIVWPTTREVGCGMAKCGRKEIWVCNYDPPGNFFGPRRRARTQRRTETRSREAGSRRRATVAALP